MSKKTSFRLSEFEVSQIAVALEFFLQEYKKIEALQSSTMVECLKERKKLLVDLTERFSVAKQNIEKDSIGKET